ncbi:MAG: hypothetical protein FJZ16_07440 [Candidatus Omnitrophica bacterium]|nr:hypothetical protein [Candidatus Omnitrophota bacterium]
MTKLLGKLGWIRQPSKVPMIATYIFLKKNSFLIRYLKISQIIAKIITIINDKWEMGYIVESTKSFIHFLLSIKYIAKIIKICARITPLSSKKCKEKNEESKGRNRKQETKKFGRYFLNIKV